MSGIPDSIYFEAKHTAIQNYERQQDLNGILLPRLKELEEKEKKEELTQKLQNSKDFLSWWAHRFG